METLVLLFIICPLPFYIPIIYLCINLFYRASSYFESLYQNIQMKCMLTRWWTLAYKILCASVVTDGGRFQEKGLLLLSSVHSEQWCFGMHAIFKATFRDPELISCQDPTGQCPTFAACLKVYSPNSNTSMLSLCMEFTFWQLPFLFRPVTFFIHALTTYTKDRAWASRRLWLNWEITSCQMGPRSLSVCDDMYRMDCHLSFSKKGWGWANVWVKESLSVQKGDNDEYVLVHTFYVNF